MAATAERVLEQDILARVHRDTVILVPHPRVLDHHSDGIVDVECVSVVAERASISVELVTGGVVADDILHEQVVHVVDAEEVLGRVLNVDAVEYRIIEVIRLEEFRLSHAAAAS